MKKHYYDDRDVRGTRRQPGSPSGYGSAPPQSSNVKYEPLTEQNLAQARRNPPITTSKRVKQTTGRGQRASKTHQQDPRYHSNNEPSRGGQDPRISQRVQQQVSRSNPQDPKGQHSYKDNKPRSKQPQMSKTHQPPDVRTTSKGYISRQQTVSSRTQQQDPRSQEQRREYISKNQDPRHQQQVSSARPQLATKADKRKSLGFFAPKPELTRDTVQVTSLQQRQSDQYHNVSSRMNPQQITQNQSGGDPRNRVAVDSAMKSSYNPRTNTTKTTTLLSNKINRSQIPSSRQGDGRYSAPDMKERNIKNSSQYNPAPNDNVALSARQVSVTFNPNKPKEVVKKKIDRTNPENHKYIGLDSSNCKYISTDAKNMVVSGGLLYQGTINNKNANEVVKAHMAGAVGAKGNQILNDDSLSFYESEYSQLSMDSTRTSPKRHVRHNRNRKSHKSSGNKKAAAAAQNTEPLTASPLTKTDWVAPKEIKRQKEEKPKQQWDERKFQKFVEADSKPNVGSDWNFRLL